jgi:hypothetical protein
MSFDSRVRDELRQAVDGHDLREEAALRQVKSTRPTEWAGFTVVALEDDLAARHSPPRRVQRILGAVAACALLAGAVALPVALRNRSRSPAPHAAGQPVTTGYRSTVTVRIGPPPAQPSTATASTTTQAVSVKLGNPARLALTPGLRAIALRRSHLPSNDPGIDFQAKTNATGDVLSLTVIAPTGRESTTLSRNWATAFGTARRADARDQLLRDRHNVQTRVTQLRSELRRVDTQLVMLAPGTYKDVLQYDAADVHPKGSTPPPPVPERATPHVLNLAFERIQILASLAQSARSTAAQRFEGFSPLVVFAQIVEQTRAVRIQPPHRHSNMSTALIAIGLLLAGAVLATSAFLVGRRSRTLRPSS